MPFDVIIPARYGSHRLPGKPLVVVRNKPLIQHVYESARTSGAARVVVATDDRRVADAVQAFGGEACMTDVSHSSGTDRLAEAVSALGLPGERVVVNVQGDEPQMPGALIDEMANALSERSDAAMATACHVINSESEFKDPNVVKVVVDANGFAMYFSRAPIPWPRDREASRAYRHIGIYAYRAGFLSKYANWKSCEVERIERLEQLRVLHYGERIVVRETGYLPGVSVDTEGDLAKFRALVS